MSRHGLPVRNRHAIPSRINRWSPNLLPRLPTSDGITDSTAAQNSSEITPIRVTGQSSLVNAFPFGRHALVHESAHPRSGATYRPGAPALPCPSHLGDCDLLFPGGQVRSRRVMQSTVPRPRALVELHAPIETVAGVDGPVAAGLAGAHRVPGRAVEHRRYVRARLGTVPQH